MALCVVGSSVMAQGTREERSVARSMMEKGDEAFESARYDEALGLYRKADAIMGVATTRLAVALSLQKLGRCIEARTVARSVADMPRSPKERAALVEARQQAADLVKELDNAIPTLHLTGLEGKSELIIAVDGELVSDAQSGTHYELDAGVHSVEVNAPGFQPFRQNLTLREGDRKRLEVNLAPLESAEAPAVVQPPPPVAVEEPPAASPVSPVAYVGFSIAAVGVATGAVTGVLSLSKTSSAREQCDGNVCAEAARGDVDAAKSLATVSNISFGVGIVAAGIGLTSWMMRSGRESTSAQAAWVVDVSPLPDGRGVSFVGRF